MLLNSYCAAVGAKKMALKDEKKQRRQRKKDEKNKEGSLRTLAASEEDKQQQPKKEKSFRSATSDELKKERSLRSSPSRDRSKKSFSASSKDHKNKDEPKCPNMLDNRGPASKPTDELMVAHHGSDDCVSMLSNDDNDFAPTYTFFDELSKMTDDFETLTFDDEFQHIQTNSYPRGLLERAPVHVSREHHASASCYPRGDAPIFASRRAIPTLDVASFAGESSSSRLLNQSSGHQLKSSLASSSDGCSSSQKPAALLFTFQRNFGPNEGIRETTLPADSPDDTMKKLVGRLQTLPETQVLTFTKQDAKAIATGSMVVTFVLPNSNIIFSKSQFGALTAAQVTAMSSGERPVLIEITTQKTIEGKTVELF